MSVRFDTRRITGTLLVALLVVALVVPACMTVACMEAPMSGDGMLGGMSLAECLDAATPYDGLLATEGFALTLVLSLVMALGAILASAFSTSLAAVGWAPYASADDPSPPLDPRGARLRV